MKRHLLIIIILSITFIELDAQIIDNKSQIIREFKNQSEQEDYWAEQLFKKEYSKRHFEKFKGDIIINGNGFTFGDKVFVVTNISKELSAIFSSGIFYPNIITGETKSTIKSQAELDTLSEVQQMLYNLTRSDSMTISNVEELKFLSNSPKYKRYRFWLCHKGLVNPTACFIELSNESATYKTELTDFIIGASLTFFREGFIGI